MANPQLENGHVKIANELQEAFWQHDFSKRQRAILDLILRLSYGCNRKSAYIPRQKYFTICGVYLPDVKKELLHLQNSKVITISKNGNFYGINKDWEQWQISQVKKFDAAAFKELLAMQLNPDAQPKEKRGRKKKVSKTLTKEKVSKTLNNKKINKYFTNNKISKTLTNKRKKLVKHETFNASIRWGCKAADPSKDNIYIIKDNVKDNIYKNGAAADLKIKDNIGAVFSFFDENIKRLTPHFTERINDWLEDIPPDLLLHVFKHAAESSKSSEAPPLTFIDRIIKRMKEKQINSIEAFEAAEKDRERNQNKEGPPAAQPKRQEYLPDWFKPGYEEHQEPEQKEYTQEEIEELRQKLAAFKH